VNVSVGIGVAKVVGELLVQTAEARTVPFSADGGFKVFRARIVSLVEIFEAHEFPQDDRKGIDVAGKGCVAAATATAAAAPCLPAHGFRSHIPERSGLSVAERIVGGPGSLHLPSQPKVEQPPRRRNDAGWLLRRGGGCRRAPPGHSGHRQSHVLGLEVPKDNSMTVEVLHSPSDLQCNLQPLLEGRNTYIIHCKVRIVPLPLSLSSFPSFPLLPPLRQLVAKDSPSQGFHDEKVSQIRSPRVAAGAAQIIGIIAVVVAVVVAGFGGVGVGVNVCFVAIVAIVAVKGTLDFSPLDPVQPYQVRMGSNVPQQEALVDQIGRGSHESPDVGLLDRLVAERFAGKILAGIECHWKMLLLLLLLLTMMIMSRRMWIRVGAAARGVRRQAQRAARKARIVV